MSTDHSVDTQSTHPATTRLQRGFTLIELVIVLAVLGALAAIAVPQLTGLQDEAELAGTAAVVSSELSNGFAQQLAAGSVNTEFVGDANTICNDTQLNSVSEALSSAVNDDGFSLDNSDGSGVEITVPNYTSSNNQVGQVSCYLKSS